mmetsp:Transcript_18521/g.25753  ORF Transcript_18521/g.25753 Transcript_18521/m.25753 type:complete len:91 (-) Transcript_18521:400-672(-)
MDRKRDRYNGDRKSEHNDVAANPLQQVLNHMHEYVQRLLKDAPLTRAIFTNEWALSFYQGLATGVVGMAALYIRDVHFPKSPARTNKSSS